LRRRRVGEGEGAAFAFMPVLYVGEREGRSLPRRYWLDTYEVSRYSWKRRVKGALRSL